MRAIIIHAPHDVQVEELPIPDPPTGNALLKVRVVGLCGSDLHAFEGTQPFFRYPEVPGHEVVADVVAISPLPDPVPPIHNRRQNRVPQVGDRVTLDPSLPCGHCYPCRHGRYNCCANMRVIGVHAAGALAEFFVAPLACLHPLPDTVSDELGVLAEPLSIGVQSNNRSRLQAGEKCLIIGAGAIGLNVLMVAKARGAACAVSDPCLPRLALARELGADLTLDPARDDLRQAVLDFTDGDGPAVVFEVVGRADTLELATEVVAAGGRVVQLGLCAEPLSFAGNVFVKKELDLLGSRLHGGTLPEAILLLEMGRISPTRLITHELRLGQALTGLRLMAEHPDEVVKVVLRP
jgi:L-gulonate 5-dehydrogenase